MQDISSEQIEIFLTVANCGNLSKAAKTLFLSQPAVSGWIGRLEETLGKTLFVRKNRGVELTVEGQRLYAELDPVYNRYRIALNNILCRGTENRDNLLSVGCLNSTEVIRIMHDICYDFRMANPDIMVLSEFYNYHECTEKLLCGELDVVFTYSFEIDGNDEMNYRNLKNTQMYYIVPKVWKVRDLHAGLSGRHLILEVNRGNRLFRRMGSEYGCCKEVKFKESRLMVIHSVAQGEGFTIGAKDVPGDEKEFLDFIPAENLPQRVDIIAEWRQNDDSPAVMKFADLCTPMEKD